MVGIKKGSSGERPRQSVTQTDCARKYCMPSTKEKQKKHKKARAAAEKFIEKEKRQRKRKRVGGIRGRVQLSGGGRRH